jgi:hypothetical protein
MFLARRLSIQRRRTFDHHRERKHFRRWPCAAPLYCAQPGPQLRQIEISDGALTVAQG